jgi:hypothetical protein
MSSKMDLDTVHSTSKQSDDHRLHLDKSDNYPDGYVEEWAPVNVRPRALNCSNNVRVMKSPPMESLGSTKIQKSLNTETSKGDISKGDKSYSKISVPKELPTTPVVTSTVNKSADKLVEPVAVVKESVVVVKEPVVVVKEPVVVAKESVVEVVKESVVHSGVVGFNAVSVILSVQNNMLLSRDNGYNIAFSTGILEGTGIGINEGGDVITFQDAGSYRFEICGEAALFSDIDAILVYDSEGFSEDVRVFSETRIPRNEGKLQLRGIPTILPLLSGQRIVTRLIPTPDESIMLLGGTRLLIHRVA